MVPVSPEGTLIRQLGIIVIHHGIARQLETQCSELGIQRYTGAVNNELDEFSVCRVRRHVDLNVVDEWNAAHHCAGRRTSECLRNDGRLSAATRATAWSLEIHQDVLRSRGLILESCFGRQLACTNCPRL